MANDVTTVPPPPWRPAHNESGKPALGIIVSKTNHALVDDFLTRHRSTLQHYFVFTTWGTYCRSLVATSKRRSAVVGSALEGYERAKQDGVVPWKCRYRWLADGYVLRPGKIGGVIQMAEHIEPSAGTDDISVLIYFASPIDVEESYPEDRALLRSVLRNNVLYLPTLRSASIWAAFEAVKRQDCDVAPQNPGKEVLALIAHDGKKMELCEWVVKNRERVRRFRHIITTGTTGKLVKRFLRAADIPKEKINLISEQQSGPLGGDVEIAGAVLRKECQNIVFFVDPMASHAHESDIQALLRVCAMEDVVVNLRLNESSATSWINTIPPVPQT